MSIYLAHVVSVRQKTSRLQSDILEGAKLTEIAPEIFPMRKDVAVGSNRRSSSTDRVYVFPDVVTRSFGLAQELVVEFNTIVEVERDDGSNDFQPITGTISFSISPYGVSKPVLTKKLGMPFSQEDLDSAIIGTQG